MADSPDVFTKTTTFSWGSRLLSSIGGVFVGIILFVAAFPVLFWNEGRAVRATRGIAEGRANVLSVTANTVDAANEGKLIHFAGPAATDETLRDPQFGVQDVALRLVRDVQMYQWVEEKHTKNEKQSGGSSKQTTTYTYTTQWRDKVIASRQFEHPEGHANPESMAVSPQAWQAGMVKVNAFALPASLVSALPANGVVDLPDEMPAGRRGRLAKLKEWENSYYLGDEPTQPKVGDLKIRFLAARAMDVSVVGRQINGSVGPYLAHSGTEILRIETGLIPADVMFKHAASENAIITWLWRIGGFLGMLIGLGLVLRPLVVLADFVPMLGSFVGVSAGVAALAVSTPLTLTTIGVAWIFYRPLLAGALLAAGVAVFVLLKKKIRTRVATPVASGAAI